MSVMYCHVCNRHIDTDVDLEHFEEHKETRDKILNNQKGGTITWQH